MKYIAIYNKYKTNKTWPLREFKLSRQDRVIKAHRERDPRKLLQPRGVAMFLCQ